MKQDCDDHEVIFKYSNAKGPQISLPNGTKVYLDDSQHVPKLHGYCNSDDTVKSKKKRAETLAMQRAAALTCLLIGQAPCLPGTEAGITPTVTGVQKGNALCSNRANRCRNILATAQHQIWYFRGTGR